MSRSLTLWIYHADMNRMPCGEKSLFSPVCFTVYDYAEKSIKNYSCCKVCYRSWEMAKLKLPGQP